MSISHTYIYRILKGQSYRRADEEAALIATVICAMKGVKVKPHEVSRYAAPPSKEAQLAELKMNLMALTNHQKRKPKPRKQLNLDRVKEAKNQ